MKNFFFQKKTTHVQARVVLSELRSEARLDIAYSLHNFLYSTTYQISKSRFMYKWFVIGARTQANSTAAGIV